MGRWLPAETRKAMSMRWSNPLFQADARRAVTDALLLGAVLWVLLLVFQVYISDLTWRLVLGVLIGSFCVAFCALRLSLSKSTWLIRIRVGSVIAGIVGIVLSVIGMAFAFWLIRQGPSNGYRREDLWPFETTALSLTLDYV